MLFGRKSENRNEPAPEPPPAPPATSEPPAAPFARPGSNRSADGPRGQSFIDASLTILGDLHSDGDLHLDGRICGNVTCGQLIVGRDAAITGAVIAEQAVIRGTVTGTIRSPVVILQDPARVESEIVYTVLAIDEGATFEGVARRSDSPLQEPESVSPLEELQRIVHSAEQAKAANGRNGGNASGSAATAEPGKAEAAPAAAANGHDREAASRRSPAA
jgi:cytoskeletal protein CcmA (bactofilin family)